MSVGPRIRSMVLCLKSCPGRELKPCLAEGIPRLHPHLAQKLEPSKPVQAGLAVEEWSSPHRGASRVTGRAASPPSPRAFSWLIYADQE